MSTLIAWGSSEISWKLMLSNRAKTNSIQVSTIFQINIFLREIWLDYVGAIIPRRFSVVFVRKPLNLVMTKLWKLVKRA